MSIDTRPCTRKSSQPIDSNAENELICVCHSQTQGGRKRLFNAAIHALRMRVERTFAWEDKFKRLLLRFERIQQRHYGMKLLGYTMIVSDHRGSNSQALDFEGVDIYPIFTVKIENPEKS